MATKLGLYNNALLSLGERPLADLTEATESRRVLDAVYDDVLLECLEHADWKFATETVKLDADTGVSPGFGSMTEVFLKPSDWVRTVKISHDEDFSSADLLYDDEADTYISAATTPIYMKYVSSDTGLGLDLAKYPPNYRRYVELELAARVCRRLTQGREDLEDMIVLRDKAKRHAENRDAMDKSQGRKPPMGDWNRSRLTRFHGDRGKRDRLIG